MISISKAAAKTINLQKAGVAKSAAGSIGTFFKHEMPVETVPSSYILPSNIFKTAKEALEEFKSEFGEVKSTTLVCEKMKQARRNGDLQLFDELSDLRQEYHPLVKKLRNAIHTKKFDTFDDYITALKAQIKENGAYINCHECSDLMCHNLRSKGIRADNVFLYTVTPENVRTSKAEHVFTLAGLDKNAKINDPSTWGNAYIVDAWSGICMPASKGIKFFEEFFGLEPSKHKLMFEFV